MSIPEMHFFLILQIEDGDYFVMFSGRYTILPLPVESPSNRLKLVFRSDNNLIFSGTKGFNLTYQGIVALP